MLSDANSMPAEITADRSSENEAVDGEIHLAGSTLTVDDARPQSTFKSTVQESHPRYSVAS
jgi:hypothetical protein